MRDKDRRYGSVRSPWKVPVCNHNNDTVSNWHPSFMFDSAHCQFRWVMVRVFELLADVNTSVPSAICTADGQCQDLHGFDETTR